MVKQNIIKNMLFSESLLLLTPKNDLTTKFILIQINPVSNTLLL